MNAQTLVFELNKIAPFQCANYKLSKNGEACFFNFNDQEAAQTLIKLNGCNFNGNVLTIVEKTDTKQLHPDKQKEIFSHVAQRYNANTKSKFNDPNLANCH
jgi:hypothetical protein